MDGKMNRTLTMTIQIIEDDENIDVSVMAPGATPADYLLAAARLVLAIGGDVSLDAIGATLMACAGAASFEVVVPS
jgi:hypothetical protein